MADGQRIRLEVRSLVGLLPMCAATLFDAEMIDRFPGFLERLDEWVARFSDALPQCWSSPQS